MHARVCAMRVWGHSVACSRTSHGGAHVEPSFILQENFTMRIRAFTLIELLIVVAIIAILAAIAVPNFLEAQTRSKVSRTKADMRSVTTAIESYAVDNNKYPM